ncbi:DUF192 domain-containing protein [Alkaliphilus sp. B6464]|uniref:DUF192 domain-containing protein n=1 Tax=Alkaliphilus sp. B6464 TaxID=2731219 RepID=UPI001BA86683|nr:DUF192 domain-containing protein [Alkaliphilus sp. B6464]QUH22114.1 DUF192 domain-containing protein [Alkaliphilus sp. B6464]
MKLYINRNPVMEIDLANDSLTRMKGLMFVKNIQKGLLIKPTNSIHTFFMKEAIDVIYIDKYSKIIKITPNMKPWKIGPIVWSARAVLELPIGTINKYRIKTGDSVEFL